MLVSEGVLKLSAADGSCRRRLGYIEIEVSGKQNGRVPTVSLGVVQGLVKLGAAQRIIAPALRVQVVADYRFARNVKRSRAPRVTWADQSVSLEPRLESASLAKPKLPGRPEELSALPTRQTMPIESATRMPWHVVVHSVRTNVAAMVSPVVAGLLGCRKPIGLRSRHW